MGPDFLRSINKALKHSKQKTVRIQQGSLGPAKVSLLTFTMSVLTLCFWLALGSLPPSPSLPAPLSDQLYCQPLEISSILVWLNCNKYMAIIPKGKSNCLILKSMQLKCSFFCGPGTQTRVLIHTRQALHCWANSPAFLLLFYTEETRITVP